MESTQTHICTKHFADILKSAGDQLRLEILKVLSQASYGVQELAFIFDMPQPGMSHHLKVLSRGGLITSRREGTSLFYRRPLITQTDPFKDLLESFFQIVDHVVLSSQTLDRVEIICSNREQASRNFFEKNADIFNERQGRITKFDQYQHAAIGLIEELVPDPQELIVEIGPGDGELLAVLADKCSHAIALDSSVDMLEKAKKNLSGFNHIDFIHGSLEDLIQKGIKSDLLALNMVLHHLPQPEKAFPMFRQLLKQNGILFLAELCSHTQEWVREACGDVWLGFPPSEIDEWAEKSHFVPLQSLYVGLKNGFQVQLKSYRLLENISLSPSDPRNGSVKH